MTNIKNCLSATEIQCNLDFLFSSYTPDEFIQQINLLLINAADANGSIPDEINVDMLAHMNIFLSKMVKAYPTSTSIIDNSER